MRVELLKYTDDPERVVALAARLCYSRSDIGDLRKNLDEEKVESLVKKIISLGHHSVLEHASFTFGIEGISRAASHQLVRHRIASYSQQSQRYVRYDKLDVVTPPSVAADPEARERFEKAMEDAADAYRWLVARGIHAEDARYVLPNATETKIVVTMNARELNHFFMLRCCRRAQWEIRDMAKEMLRLVKGVAPVIFGRSGPGCLRGGCTEGEFTCGKPDEVRKEFENL